MAELTPEQARAVEADAPRVFVSAGAGTGKTRLLVARYMRAVLQDGSFPAELPTVTFTRKAAAELRNRIRLGLLAAGRTEIAWSLDTAPIGTIHSLCSALLRSDPMAAGVDPGFTVLEDEQSAILRSHAFELAWRATVEGVRPGEIDLVGRLQSSLRQEIPPLYVGLRGLGCDRPRFTPTAPPDLIEAKQRLGSVLSRLLDELRSLELAGAAADNADRARECLEWLPGVRPGWEDLDAVDRFRPLLTVGKATKELFSACRDELTAFRQVLGAHTLIPLAEFADRLLVRFDAEYRVLKAARGALDFNDLELRALDMVTRGARPFGDRCRLMVDEFQDTNALQVALLEALDPASFLTVGDVHQSIYAFRGADVEVFVRQEQVCRAESGDTSLVTSLRDNFRSRGAVLDVVNRIFAQDPLFGSAYAPLEARRIGDAPRGEADEAQNEDRRGLLAPAVEIIAVDRRQAGAGDATDTEAFAVADRISRLLNDEGWRPRDVVILSHTLNGVHAYEDALAERDIPAYVVHGKGYFRREELFDVLSLLRSLVNPYDDLSLVTALRSPLGSVGDDVLLLLRMQSESMGGVSLWEALQQGDVAGADSDDAARLRLFTARIASLRRRVGSHGLSSLLAESVEAFDYDLVLLQAPDGRRRFGNVRKLMRLADEFEALEGPDLAGFIKHLDLRRDLTADREGNAALLAEDDDVVRMMTIHQAKGLEFPVVVLTGMGRSPRRSRSDLSFGRDGGVAVSIARDDDTNLGGRIALGPAEEILDARALMEREESVRLYYVAMTRAEERLVLVGLNKPADTGTLLAQVLGALGVAVGEPQDGEVLRPQADLDLVVYRRSPSPEVPGVVAQEAWAAAPAAPPPLAEGLRRAGVQRISFSALAHYDRCPRGYYLERVLGLHRVPGRDPGGLEHVVDQDFEHGREPGGIPVGLLVHAALESLALGSEPSPEVLQGVLRAAASRSADVPGGDVLGGPEHLDRAAALVRAFWRSPLAQDPTRSLARTEVPFVFSRKDVLVTGALDLLYAGPDRWWAVDYKSNRLAGRTVEEAAREYERQADLYALACLLGGAPRVTLSFLFLERPEEPVSRVFETTDRARLELALDTALEGIQAGRFPRREQECAACSLSEVCMV